MILTKCVCVCVFVPSWLFFRGGGGYCSGPWRLDSVRSPPEPITEDICLPSNTCDVFIMSTLSEDVVAISYFGYIYIAGCHDDVLT